jgi:hypothetical protein
MSSTSNVTNVIKLEKKLKKCPGEVHLRESRIPRDCVRCGELHPVEEDDGCIVYYDCLPDTKKVREALFLLI